MLPILLSPNQSKEDKSHIRNHRTHNRKQARVFHFQKDSHKTIPHSHHTHNLAHEATDLNTKPNSFVKGLKELFTVKRLSIVSAVLVASHFIGNFIRNAIGISQNRNSDQGFFGSHVLQEAAVIFTQILVSSLIAITLDNRFSKGLNFKHSIKEAFSNESLKLALSLSAFNTLADTATHSIKHSNFYQNSGTNQTITDLTSLLVKFLGTIAVGRLVAGANSITTMFSTACPCCSMPICAVELFTLLHSLWQSAVSFVNRHSHHH
ncbi:MAG: hypothetical protein QNJ31_06575 [Candidatus Caenarcaniphilales bacterium]|nr:hypothetical protein [Candidatus Caenarcaniphilales bacterium]